MSRFIDDFYEVLFKPFLAFDRIAREHTAWHGLLVYLGVSLISAISVYGAADTGIGSGDLSRFMTPEAVDALLRSWPLLNLFIRLILAPFYLFISAAILHFSAELNGGNGRSLTLAAALGYAQLPYILVAPFGLAARYLQVDLVWLAALAAFFWSLFLKIEAIRSIYGFSRRRAVFVYLLPFAAVITALIMLLTFGIIFLRPFLSMP